MTDPEAEALGVIMSDDADCWTDEPLGLVEPVVFRSNLAEAANGFGIVFIAPPSVAHPESIAVIPNEQSI
ncbi:MAG: hypothetical protein ACKOC1_12505 [Hyphomicrobiales bacterium]